MAQLQEHQPLEPRSPRSQAEPGQPKGRALIPLAQAEDQDHMQNNSF